MPIVVPGDAPGPGPGASDRFAVSRLVEETLLDLAGFTSDMGQSSALKYPIGATDLTFQVVEAGQTSRGVVEIGDELIYVLTSQDGTCTVAPYGRGYRSTLAKSWPAGTEVNYAPRFPRHVVLSAINDSISSVWPHLFAVGETSFTFTPTQGTFPLPAEAEKIQVVEWDPAGPQKTWVRIDSYNLNEAASTGDFPTGKSIDLPWGLEPGRTVRVRYLKRPTLVAYEDNLTDSGLSDSAWRCVKHGALADLLTKISLGTVGVDSAESNEWARVRPQDPLKTSQHHYALHIQYRDEERARLLAANPLTVHFAR